MELHQTKTLLNTKGNDQQSRGYQQNGRSLHNIQQTEDLQPGFTKSFRKSATARLTIL